MYSKEGLKRYKQKNKEQIAHYSQAYYRNRHDSAIQKLGGRCFVGTTEVRVVRK